jgi:hypothetical protein
LLVYREREKFELARYNQNSMFGTVGLFLALSSTLRGILLLGLAALGIVWLILGGSSNPNNSWLTAGLLVGGLL